jgi:hypothetical protein
MKALVHDGRSGLTTKVIRKLDSNGDDVQDVVGLEIQLIKTTLQQMNMTFLATIADPVQMGKNPFGFIYGSMLEKRFDIYLGGQVNRDILFSLFDTTTMYHTASFCWYVPCSVKYPRWSSIYRILSVELWVVLIISVATVAISTTLVGQYSCTSEWQGYKTLTSSLTNVWAVIVGVSVSTMPRAPSLRSLFLAWVCFCIAFSTVFQAFLTTFLIDSGYETPIQNMDELLDSGM